MVHSIELGAARITVHESTDAHTVTLHVCGVFDRDNCEHIADAVRDALAAGHRTINLDVRQVTLIDAATARTLLSCRALVHDAGGTMPIINAADGVARVLNLTTNPPHHRRGAGPAPMTDDRAPSGSRGRTPSAWACTATEVAATSALLIERAHGLVDETRRIRAMSTALLAGCDIPAASGRHRRHCVPDSPDSEEGPGQGRLPISTING